MQISVAIETKIPQRYCFFFTTGVIIVSAVGRKITRPVCNFLYWRSLVWIHLAAGSYDLWAALWWDCCQSLEEKQGVWDCSWCHPACQEDRWLSFPLGIPVRNLTWLLVLVCKAMWVSVPHLSIVTGAQEQQGYSWGCWCARRGRSLGLSQWGPCSGWQRRGEKPNPCNCKQISECSVLLHSSQSAVHSNMPLQQERGKTEKLNKLLAHPSTWKESGFNAGEKGCKQNKRWFVLTVYF